MKISKRDWVQLSAYVDGELTQRELTRLEARIENNPEFQAALEGLKEVKAVLAHTPRLAPPRNFTLQGSPVQSPQKQIPTRGYRLAAAVLSFLFIGVVVVDLGSTALSGGMLASQAPRAEEVLLESAADEMEETALLAAEEAAEGELIPDLEMETMAEAPENYQGVEEGEVGVMEESLAKSAEEDADRAAGGGEDVVGEVSEDSSNGLPEEERSALEEEQIAPSPEVERTDDIRQIPWLRIIEILLGLGAVGFGGAAWLKRRKSRKL